MYFKRLEMHGFKSFADPVVIEFHEGITCVVGPNGSGKSNISDAIRWVLGEQSPKALRGGKMEEVIFAGTASRKSRGMAEVVLVIDNSSGILNVDYNEVAITRRMYRSGESEYLINNNPCRLRDIRELIMDTGIGVDGYSLIGQGKIADIVSTKPESRREIFEEAAGVVMYKNRRSDTEKKLESTSANLERVDDIVSEIESRIGQLKDDSEKAKEFVNLRDKYKDLEINLILRNIANLEKNSDIYKTDIAGFEAEISKVKEESEKLINRYEELTSRRELLDRLSDETRDKIMDAVQRINSAISEGKLSEQRLVGIENESNIINSDIVSINERKLAEEEMLTNVNDDFDYLSKELESASLKLNEKIARYNELASQQAEKLAEADDGKRKVFELHNRVSASESESKGYENLKKTLLRRREELEALRDENSEADRQISDSLSGNLQEIEEGEDKAERLRTKLSELEASIAKTSQNIKDKEEQLARERLEAGRIQTRLHTIEEMENNYEGYNLGVRSLMKKNLSGIRGVTAELMEVPKGYELAVETAMGASLQNVICESDDDAKRAVKFLKENRVGRITFLPITSIRAGKQSINDKIKDDKGFVGMAVDIVKFDKELANIYSYLLGRVAIVKDMDSAIRLSKISQGLRFVTPEGEIVNASGAITGGAYKNKSANLLERKAEIGDLEKGLKAYNLSIDKMVEELSKLKARQTDEREMFNDLSYDFREADLNLNRLKSLVESEKIRAEEQSKSLKRVESELAEIDKQTKEADELILKLNNQAEKLQNEIKKIQSNTETVLREIDSIKAETDKASEGVTKHRISLNEIETRLENSEAEKSKIKRRLEAMESQLNDKLEALDKLKLEKDLLLNSRDNKEVLEIFEREKLELESNLAEVSEDRQTVITQLQEFDEKQKLALDKLNGLRDNKYQLDLKISKSEAQLESLKEKLWDEFEISYAQAMDFQKEDFVYSQAIKEERRIKSRMRELGDVNIGAIAEYEQVSERYEFLTSQRNDINAAKEELVKIISDMDKTIRRRFKDNFDKVVVNFEEIFKSLFGGGYAELRLEDENNPLTSGIEIIAQPPGKKLQNINLMSGGEKTMTAIALMFAVLKTKPTPFCILDEVEAALDDSNIDRFAEYLKNFKEIQFTLVTHQKATMEHADVLYGVTMPEHGISKLLSLRLGDDFDIE